MTESIPGDNDRWNPRLVPTLFDKGIITLLILFIILGITMTLNSGFELKSDGPNYFVYLRSVVFDQDIDFRNEYFNFDKAFWDTYRPKFSNTGYYTNVFSVGPAILWAPFYIASHIFVLAANLMGAGYTPDGFSEPYVYAANLASLVYSFFGTVLVYKTCSRYFPRLTALMASVTAFFSTFIIYYVIFQPYMSHSVSYFSVSLFLWYWDMTRRNRTTLQWSFLGVITGIMMLVRWQNGLFMILPAFDSLVVYRNCISSGDRPSFLAISKNNLFFLMCAIAVFIPQMLTWKIIYGGFLTIPQGSSFLRWSTPFISEVLFSSRHGLFSWSPVVYLSTAGWFIFYKRDKLLFWGGTTAFVLMLYINSIVSDWWAGWGFGMRRFDGFILLFAFGLASLFSGMAKNRPRTSTVLMTFILIFFTVFNFNLMNSANTDLHPGGPVRFDHVLGLNDKSFYLSAGYPFSFPANALFSLEYQEPLSRYDTLIGGYVDDPLFYGNTILMGESSPLLKMGWSDPREYRWRSWRIMEKQASVYAPILNVTDFIMIFNAKALTTPDKQLTVYLNGIKVGSVHFKPEWHRYPVKLPKKFLKTGLNIITFINNSDDAVSFESISFYSQEYIPGWK